MSLKTCMFLYVNYVHFGMTYMHYNTPSRTKHRHNLRRFVTFSLKIPARDLSHISVILSHVDDAWQDDAL